MKISSQCLKDLLDDGFSQSQVARTCSMSRQAISNRLKYKYKSPGFLLRRFGIKFLFQIGFEIRQIAEYTGYKEKTVCLYLSRWGYSIRGRCHGMEPNFKK